MAFMKYHLLYVFLIPLALSADQPISSQQADAIVASEMAAKNAKRQAEVPNFHVLQRKVVLLEDGKRLILDEVAKPRLVPQPPPVPTPLTAEELEQINAVEQGTYDFISLSVWVYDNEFSLIRWNDDIGNQYSAWVRDDMNLCRTINEFSDGHTTYRLTMMILNESTAEMKERQKIAEQEGIDLQLPEIPNLPKPQNGLTEYFVETSDDSILENAEAFDGLEALFAYLDSNRADLNIALANQKKLSEAKKRYDAQNPKSKDSTVTYWINPQ